jgi:hypothetical protein
VNRQAIGLNSRDGAKTWTYAYLYGAGDLKLGKIAYDDMTEAQRDGVQRKHRRRPTREKALASSAPGTEADRERHPGPRRNSRKAVKSAAT